MLRATDCFDGRVYEFEDLDAYQRSPFWLVTKLRYRQSDRPQDCYACERSDTQLHHVRYDRLGMELDDLVPLCEDHHYEVEKHIAKDLPGVTRRNAHESYRQQYESRRVGKRRPTIEERLASEIAKWGSVQPADARP